LEKFKVGRKIKLLLIGDIFMDKSKNFQDTIVWQKAHSFVLEIYKITQSFPKEEMFGLTSQIRRAAVSIPANFVEGFKRKSINDKLRFYNISQASLEEVRYFLILTNDLKYADTADLQNKIEEVSKLLYAYSSKL
jgi:four helix bundle protein